MSKQRLDCTFEFKSFVGLNFYPKLEKGAFFTENLWKTCLGYDFANDQKLALGVLGGSGQCHTGVAPQGTGLPAVIKDCWDGPGNRGNWITRLLRRRGGKEMPAFSTRVGEDLESCQTWVSIDPTSSFGGLKKGEWVMASESHSSLW